MALRKLPPEVVRELRRHISPRPLPSPRNPQQQQQRPGGDGHINSKSTTTTTTTTSRMRYVLMGCLGLTATAATFPIVATWWVGHLHKKDNPLTPAQVRRGAFLNSGSRDVGRDPNWDFHAGEYKNRDQVSGYLALSQEDHDRKRNKKTLSAEFLPMSEEQMKKHEESMKRFAVGQSRHKGN